MKIWIVCQVQNITDAKRAWKEWLTTRNDSTFVDFKKLEGKRLDLRNLTKKYNKEKIKVKISIWAGRRILIFSHQALADKTILEDFTKAA